MLTKLRSFIENITDRIDKGEIISRSGVPRLAESVEPESVQS